MASISTPDVNTFESYVHLQPITQRELPLVHTTECHRLPSIRATHMLEPQICSVFGEPLLYFFYGRPSYRDPTRTMPIKDVGYCPLSFVFKPDRKFSIARMYPFDTGASQKGLYEPEIKANQALQKYHVAAVIESAQKIVHRFFETNDNYLACKPRIGLAFNPTEVDAEAYYKLVKGGGQPECDDRRSAIEVQIADKVSLREHLMAVVMPTNFLEDTDLRRTLFDEWHAHPLTYDADMGMRPTEFHGNIREMIREYYESWRFI